jgi:hypothetical protein
VAAREGIANCVEAGPADENAYSAICAPLARDADIVVSALTLPLVHVALAEGTPTLLIDSLAWM